jgi:hypothetical protein
MGGPSPARAHQEQEHRLYGWLPRFSLPGNMVQLVTIADQIGMKLRPLGNKLVRGFFVMMALLMLIVGIRTPAQEWDFRWWHLPVILLLYVGPTIILPLTLQRPFYRGDIAKADFSQWLSRGQCFIFG